MTQGGTGEKVLSATFLPHIHEDLSSDPLCVCENSGVADWATL